MSEEQFLREQYEEQGGADESPEYPSESGCGAYGYVILGILAVFLLANVWRFFALTGSFSTTGGDLAIYNEANIDLDTAAIESATELLRNNFGINISIFTFETIPAPDLSDFSPYFNFVSQRDYSAIPANSLVFVIGIDDQYSEITWGENLNRIDGNRIRSEIMNPRLQEGDFTGALVQSFEASQARLQLGNLAFGELLSVYGENLQAILTIGAFIGLMIWALYRYLNGDYDGNGGGYYNRYYHHHHSSGSGSGSRSSGSGRSGGGGSSRGSWK